MKVILDLDDFSPTNTSIGLLEEIKDHYPNFKITLFTVPWEIRFGTPTNITEYITLKDGTKERKYKAFIKMCQNYADWMEIAIHGLSHSPQEFLNLSFEDAKKRIMVAEKMFLNTGIPYAKLFKAPFWQLSSAGKKAAASLGFVVAEDHYYNWNLKDDMEDKQPLLTDPRKKGDSEYIIGHGHVHMTEGNGLEEVVHRILRLPADTQFHFLSEWFGATKVDPQGIDFRDPLEQVDVIYKGSGEKL